MEYVLFYFNCIIHSTIFSLSSGDIFGKGGIPSSPYASAFSIIFSKSSYDR